MPTKIPIRLPQMGESVAEATIVEWLKKVGDLVAIDEIFVTIGTDKVESDLPSAYEGILTDILVLEGEVCAVDSIIALFEVADSVAESLNNKYTPDKNENETVKFDPTKHDLIKKSSDQFLSPIVRKIAALENLSVEDLSKIKTSGNANRLTKKDLVSHIHKIKNEQSVLPSKLDLKIAPGDRVKEISRRQKLLAKHLQASYNEIPHVTTFKEIDVTDIFEYRNSIKSSFNEQFNTNITFSHFFQFAIIQSLKKYPLLNSWMNVDELIVKNSMNIGFATALENGDLIVPNVKNAQSLCFVDWIKSINQKALQAKTNQLQADDTQDTSFTISNTGVFGSTFGTPIISKPQVGVLALGEIVSKPGIKVNNGIEEITIRKIMIASLSYDHRIINGAYASKFLSDFASFLKQENFSIEQ